MRSAAPSSGTLLVTILILLALSVAAQSGSIAPDETAAMIVKLAGFEKNMSGSPAALIAHVIGAPEVGAELEKNLGAKIGAAKLKKVVNSDTMPDYRPDILFIGDPGKLNQALTFSHKHKVLTVTNIPGLVRDGITLGIEPGPNGKPEVYLNLRASAEEGLDWNSAIMKVVKTIK